MKKGYLWILLLLVASPTLFSQSQMDGLVQSYFATLAEESSFKQNDLTQWRVTDVVPSLNPEIKHVYVQQYHNNIPIQFGTYKLTVRNNKVTWEINQFVTDVAEKISCTSPAISPERAVMKTVQAHNLRQPTLNATRSSDGIITYNDSGISLEPIKVTPMYQQHEGVLRLVWNVSLYQKDGQHWWNENIDATNGQILQSYDWVITCNWGDAHDDHDHEHDHVVAKMNENTITVPTEAESFLDGESYNVYAMPLGTSLDGNRSIVNDPQDLTASPFGWHDTNGSNGAEYTITRGNNVWAQEDANGNNGVGYAPDGGSGLDFNFPINLNNQPSTYRDAAITNLFYWNNIMHDVFYQYGFD